VFPAHATASGGLPDLDPVGSAIAGPAKTLRIHQGFQQRTMPIATFMEQRPFDYVKKRFSAA
jgi:hypothetical protein